MPFLRAEIHAWLTSDDPAAVALREQEYVLLGNGSEQPDLPDGHPEFRHADELLDVGGWSCDV
eukprot:3655096-Pleurochrysis_carterae.AAC.1